MANALLALPWSLKACVGHSKELWGNLLDGIADQADAGLSGGFIQ
jgi:hypothetical protein